MTRAEFAYVQARLQARYGALAIAATAATAPSAGTAPPWHALDASRTAEHYLALTRSGPLAEWTEGLDRADDVHRVERHLRQRWQHHVDAVARWLPSRWQAATREFGALPGLPLQGAERRAGAAARWLEGWQRLWPADAGDAAALRKPAELLLPRLRDAAAVRAANAEPVRRVLRRLFRRHAASAVAVFAYLALVALDLERLRGGIVVRSLFGSLGTLAPLTSSESGPVREAP